MSAKRFFIETFGCQMNVHDSEKMSGVLTREGHIPAAAPGESDLIIFNTCCIRQKAEQKFFSELGRIKKLKRKNPGLKIAVAGCIAQQQGGKIFRRAPYVDFVFGPQNIHLLKRLISGDAAPVAVEANPYLCEMELPVQRCQGSRAWVSIMFGCNNFCSYCIVPYTRGREQSRPSENILREVEELAGSGFKEVTLLGQNVNSYRSDTDFPGLLHKIDGVAGLERVRFVTSHPRDLSEELMLAVQRLHTVCEHIHLPLQSGSTRILGLMNRGYSYEQYAGKVDALRNIIPGISITADIIAGFPGETDEDHRRTVQALKDIEYDGIFAFKYSPREGTRAAAMGMQIPDEVKSQRLFEILEVQDGITLEKNRKIEDSTQEILVEGPSETDPGMLTGKTRSNKIVNFRGMNSQVGKLIRVKITSARKHSLDGEVE